MRYKDYLKSDRWKRQRRRTFYYHGKRCVICGAKKVDVHHLTYKSIGEEHPKKHLIPLCRFHHKQVHDYANAHDMNIWNATHKLTTDYRSKHNPRKLTWKQMTPYQREKFLGPLFMKEANRILRKRL